MEQFNFIMDVLWCVCNDRTWIYFGEFNVLIMIKWVVLYIWFITDIRMPITIVYWNKESHNETQNLLFELIKNNSFHEISYGW